MSVEGYIPRNFMPVIRRAKLGLPIGLNIFRISLPFFNQLSFDV
jgi:hypothetical protein